MGGIYLPTLLLLAVVAAALTWLLVRMLGALGVYRFVAYRALVDLCLFVFVLAALAILLPLLGIHQ